MRPEQDLIAQRTIEDQPMHVNGVSWHVVMTSESQLPEMSAFLQETLGLAARAQAPGFALFAAPDGSMVELATDRSAPSYGYNGAIAFGFAVDDVEASSSELEQAGCELLGEIMRSEDRTLSWRHFRGPDGRVYGLLNQSLTAEG